jgi:hypothetical protein
MQVDLVTMTANIAHSLTGRAEGIPRVVRPRWGPINVGKLLMIHEVKSNLCQVIADGAGASP